MNLAVMLMLSAGLALAPVAQAQISCAEAENLVDAAFEDFDALLGEEVDDGVYAATYSLGGAAGCQVTLDFSVTYGCMWSYADAASAREQFGLQAHAIANCFGDWERGPYTYNSGQAGLITLDGQSFFAEADDGGEFTWMAYSRNTRRATSTTGTSGSASTISDVY